MISSLATCSLKHPRSGTVIAPVRWPIGRRRGARNLITGFAASALEHPSPTNVVVFHFALVRGMIEESWHSTTGLFANFAPTHFSDLTLLRIVEAQVTPKCLRSPPTSAGCTKTPTL